MKKNSLLQKVLIGRTKRPAELITSVGSDETKFIVRKAGKIVATRTTCGGRISEEDAIRRLAKSLNGLCYVYVVKVEYDKSFSFMGRRD